MSALLSAKLDFCEKRALPTLSVLINVMEMHLDGTVANIQLAANFLVRQTFGYQAHDLVLSVS
jgi:hypothetical protein